MEHYIWSYIISGTNKATQLLTQYPEECTSLEVAKAKQGLQLIILLGMASSVEGFLRKILTEFNTKQNSESLHIENIKPVEEQSWFELKKTFNNSCPTKLSKVLKKADKNLNEGLDILFAYRNFIAHSKHMKITGEYEVELGGITKYLKKHNLEIEAEWFIDRIIDNEVVFHFKKLVMKIFEINFHKYFETQRLVDNFIDENDFTTNEYSSLIYTPEE